MMSVLERDMSVFRNGRSRAIRIPDEFGLEGDVLTLRKTSDGVVTIAPKRSKEALLALLDEFAADPLDEADLPDTWRIENSGDDADGSADRRLEKSLERMMKASDDSEA